jgi:thiamine biosynthesis lipoprotein
MGSPLRLTAVGSDAEPAWLDVVEEFADSDLALSRFRDDAELVALDRAAGTGGEVRVTRRLERAIVAAERARRLTGGRFEPRILGDLERLGERGADLFVAARTGIERRGRRPPAGPIASRPRRGYLTIDRPIDLGGIGKGLALRWAARRLDRYGLDGFLIDAGGDIVARGGAPEGGPWQIGIEDPVAGNDVPLAVIRLRDGAIATSSIRRRRWDHEGRPVHHLIDPTTGLPAWSGLLAVTVAGPDPAWAEVWAKTLFLYGQAEIAAEARRRGLAAWWVADGGTLAMTAAARSATVWVKEEAVRDHALLASATSSAAAVGMPSRAPAFVTASVPAATARRADSSRG